MTIEEKLKEDMHAAVQERQAAEARLNDINNERVQLESRRLYLIGVEKHAEHVLSYLKENADSGEAIEADVQQ